MGVIMQALYWDTGILYCDKNLHVMQRHRQKRFLAIVNNYTVNQTSNLS